MILYSYTHHLTAIRSSLTSFSVYPVTVGSDFEGSARILAEKLTPAREDKEKTFNLIQSCFWEGLALNVVFNDATYGERETSRRKCVDVFVFYFNFP